MKYLITLIFSVFLITSCSNEPKTLRLGFNTWAGYESVVIADKKKFFAKEGVKVEVKQYNSLPEVMQAFAEGKIDVMFSTSNEVILLANKGEKLKMALVADYSNGADVIVAQKDINSIKDLEDKKVGVVANSISNYILLKALQKAKLTESDIRVVDATEKDALSKFKEKSVSAITTWYPYSEEAIQSGGHVIFSTSQIPGQVVDVMSIRQDIIDKYPDRCKKIVSAYLKALDWFSQNPQEGMIIIADAANMSVEEMENSLKGLRLTGVKDNVAAFGTPTKKGSLYGATQTFIDFLLWKEVITEKLKAEELIDPTFIWDAALTRNME